MRKFIYLFSAFIIGLSLNSCKCTKENDNHSEELIVENIISVDRQDMYFNYNENYIWFETGVLLKNWLDEENDGSIEMVVNVFETVESMEPEVFDTIVYKYQHTIDKTTKDVIHGFWVEDFALNNEKIVITFKEAYEKVMNTNLPKPHTRQVFLRKMVGPKICNPQWIFGNIHTQIYVDAVTGEITDVNPAFNK